MTAEEELMELREQNSLLLEQVKQIPVLQEIITQLSEQVKQLQEQLAKDSHNSSLPPSSYRCTRQSKSRSLRTRSGKKPGGQPGHRGQTLQMSATPDEVIVFRTVIQCIDCQAHLAAVSFSAVE